MSSNQSKKRKNKFNNCIKQLLFGKGLKPKTIIAGKAGGIKMYIDPVFKFQRLIGADEYEVQDLFVQYTKTCNYFFDVGASDGYYCLLYKKYNAAGQAFLFDSDARFKDIQQSNLALNNISTGYNSYAKYVGDKNDDQNITLDSFKIEKQHILIKIDVEGAELNVLKGTIGLLKQNNCYLVIETHSHLLEKNCVNFLENNQYKTSIIKNAWWRFMLAERRPLEHNRWLAAIKI